MITIAAPIIGEEEIAAVNKVLLSGMLAQGPMTASFEAEMAKYCGTKYAVAVNSGTAAIHAALYSVGIGPGNEVITTPYSFIATINPIIMLGAKPVLVDIQPDTFNIDVDKISKVITKKTKAIIPVHLYGQTVDMAPLKALAKKHNLKIVEDACQAIGAGYKQSRAGNLGDLGCFSLYATKNIMSGEGGIVTTNNKKYAELIRQFRQHGMTAQYEYVDVGYNYRITDLQAAIAGEQLKKVDKFNVARQKNAELLRAGLQSIPGLIMPATAKNRTHVYHQFTIRVTKDFPLSPNDLTAKLRERGIIAGRYYPKPLHSFKHIQKYGYRIGDFPEAERAANEVLSLPVHPLVSKKDTQEIIRVIKELANAGQ